MDTGALQAQETWEDIDLDLYLNPVSAEGGGNELL